MTISTIQKLYKKGLRQTRDNVSFRCATRSLARPSVSVKCLQSSRARRGTLAWRGREASGGGVRQGTKARSSRRGAEGGRRSRRGAVGVRAETGNTGYRTNEKGSREPGDGEEEGTVTEAAATSPTSLTCLRAREAEEWFRAGARAGPDCLTGERPWLQRPRRRWREQSGALGTGQVVRGDTASADAARAGRTANTCFRSSEST